MREESRAGGVPWEGFRGRDPVREESRWNRKKGIGAKRVGSKQFRTWVRKIFFGR